MKRDYWLPAFGLAFVVIAIAVLIGVCRQSVVADQQPLPTRTPTVEPTASPTMIPPPTIAAVVIVPTVATPVPTSTLTPLPTATATQERQASEFNTPGPTATVPRAPAQAPAPIQVPRRP